MDSESSNADELNRLRLQVARLTERLGPDPDAQPVVSNGFPKVVYRAQDDPDPKQIDHPGWDAKRVDDAFALERAIADGWQDAIGEYVYPEPEPVPVKKSKAKK